MESADACSAHDAPPAGTGAPVPRALERSLGYLLQRAHLRARGSAKHVLPARTHPRDVAVLRTLQASQFGSQLELAEALGVNRTLMVGHVDQLTQDGYLERRRDPEDRRRYLLDLTEAGELHLAALLRTATDGEQRFNAMLEPPEAARLNTLLRPIAMQRLSDLVPDDLLGLNAFLCVHCHFRMLSLALPRMEPLSMQPRHYGVLAVLDDLGPVTQQRLATQMRVGGATVVEIIDALEEAGRVRRRPGVADRRTKELVVTAKGRRDLGRCREVLEEVQAEATQDLGVAGREDLVALLRRLVGSE